MERKRRTGFAGDIRGCRAGDQEYLLLFARKLLDRERCTDGDRKIDDHVIDSFRFEPSSRNADSNVRFHQDVSVDNFDWLAEDASAEILHGHPRRIGSARPACVGADARLVTQHADLDDVVGNLRSSAARQHRCGHQQGNSKKQTHHDSGETEFFNNHQAHQLSVK